MKLEIAFIILLTYAFTWFFLALKISSDDEALVKKRVRKFSIAVFVWIAYVFVVGRSGLLLDTGMPPRMPLLLVLPAFGVFAWFFITKRHLPFLKSTPVYFPILFQSFRIFVELIIWWCFLNKLIPIEPTFEGYNYELYFGLSSLVIGVLAIKGKLSKSLIVAWNVIGLCFLTVIVIIFVTVLFSPSLWGYEQAVVDPTFMNFPYMLIPAVYMPAAVFVHIFSILQNKRA